MELSSCDRGRLQQFLVGLGRRLKGQQRLVRRRRESSQVGHHAKVFSVEAAALVVRDDPDRADGFPTHVEGDQQPFFKKGRDLAEVGKIAFGM